MNQIQTLNQTKTMSSREIAELTGKEHKNVMRDIREMFSQLNFEPSKYSGIFQAENGHSYEEYFLSKDLTLTLVSGYSVILRKKIIDRWLELEKQESQPKQMTFLETAKALVSALEKIEEQKPAVEFVERYVESSSTKGIREVGKILNIPQNQFVEKLLKDKILYRDIKGSLKPYAENQKNGRFEVKEVVKNGIAISQTRFTTDGIVWAAKKYGK